MMGLYQSFSVGTRGKIIDADTRWLVVFFHRFGLMFFALPSALPFFARITLAEVSLISFPHFQHFKGANPAFRKRAGVAKFWVRQYGQG